MWTNCSNNPFLKVLVWVWVVFKKKQVKQSSQKSAQVLLRNILFSRQGYEMGLQHLFPLYMTIF